MSTLIGTSGEGLPAGGQHRLETLTPVTGTTAPVAPYGGGRPAGASAPGTLFARQLRHADELASGTGVASRTVVEGSDPGAVSGVPSAAGAEADALATESVAPGRTGLPGDVVPTVPGSALASLPTWPGAATASEAGDGMTAETAETGEPAEPIEPGEPAVPATGDGDRAAPSTADEVVDTRVHPLGTVSAPSAAERSPRPASAPEPGAAAARSGEPAADDAVRSPATGTARDVSAAALPEPPAGGAPAPAAATTPSVVTDLRTGTDTATRGGASPVVGPSPAPVPSSLPPPPRAGATAAPVAVSGPAVTASRSSVSSAPSAESRTVSATVVAESSAAAMPGAPSAVTAPATSVTVAPESGSTSASSLASRTAPSPVHPAGGDAATVAAQPEGGRPPPVATSGPDAAARRPDVTPPAPPPTPPPTPPVEAEEVLPHALVSRRPVAARALHRAEAQASPRAVVPHATSIAHAERAPRVSTPVESRRTATGIADAAATSPLASLAFPSNAIPGIGGGPLAMRADEPFGTVPVAPHSVPLNGRADGADALAASVRWSAATGGGRALVNVTPDGLGPLSIRVDLDGDRVSVSIVAAQLATREALEMLVPRLREQLAADGQPGTRVEVEISGGRGDGGVPADTGRSARHGRSGTGRAETNVADDLATAHDRQGSDVPSRFVSRSIIDAWA